MSVCHGIKSDFQLCLRFRYIKSDINPIDEHNRPATGIVFFAISRGVFMPYSSLVSQPEQSLLKRMFMDPTSSIFMIWVRLVNFFIFISCISMALETVEPFATVHHTTFLWVEILAVAIFTVDYLGNLWTAKHKIKYIFSFWGLVDLISILPSYLMLMNLTALQGSKVLRLLRVIRVLRVLKLAREALRQIGAAHDKKTNPLVVNLRIYFIALFSVLMISSTLMYYVEGSLYSTESMAKGQALLDANPPVPEAGKEAPKEPPKFVPVDPVSGNPIPEDKRFYSSIPTAMWWCIVTLTTTGYGDMYPVTFWGRVIAGVTMLMGLVLFGILMNIVGKTLMVMLFGETLEDGNQTTSANAEEKEHQRVATVLKMLAAEGVIDANQVESLSKLHAPEIAKALKSI